MDELGLEYIIKCPQCNHLFSLIAIIEKQKHTFGSEQGSKCTITGRQYLEICWAKSHSASQAAVAGPVSRPRSKMVTTNSRSNSCLPSTGTYPCLGQFLYDCERYTSVGTHHSKHCHALAGFCVNGWSCRINGLGRTSMGNRPRGYSEPVPYPAACPGISRPASKASNKFIVFVTQSDLSYCYVDNLCSSANAKVSPHRGADSE